MAAERVVYGWDLGGANIKATRLEDGVVRDIAQWACPLWQGLHLLDDVLAQARARWPDCGHAAHAVTMTGEMADLFEHREAGVVALADIMWGAFGECTVFFAGAAGWRTRRQVAADWQHIASANWVATARMAAERIGHGVLVDIGTTTSDLIPIVDGEVAAHGRDDAGRLASGELVYLGVARTPLCALARRIALKGTRYNVMNELFATTADVYRITGELPDAHDPHPAADGGAKTPEATRQRLARMIGHDARDASPAAWLEVARAWRQAQIAALWDNLLRVIDRSGLPPDAPLIGAGCGHFLARDLAGRLGRPYRAFEDLAGMAPAHAEWARVCAPSIAVAVLLWQAGDEAVAMEGTEACQ
ncbi:hydantoinase/oxoprolinase family protein [Cupriavidus basilensis]|uniref:hydantoinase/oxoprolinase family protein n=1 Tax=Cupriavidus basilensis TaxID=68895 RepID=UPI0039F7417A